METHGGNGLIFSHCYAHLDTGIVFEKDPTKAAILGKQRPTWAVYEADCIGALASGVGNHLPINFLDLDPYGDPWPVLDAFFEGRRNLSPILAIVVNDGLRQKVKMGGAWNAGSLSEVVSEFGNDLYPIYLEVCQELMIKKAVKAGYHLDRFGGYYCGHLKQMTHYYALLQKN